MFNLYVFVPIIAMIAIVVWYNIRFISTTKRVRLIYILLESSMLAGLSYFLFFHGFVTSAPQIIVLILLVTSTGIVLFVLSQHQYENFYLHWKVIGNALLVFLKVGLPLYLFLTIFRYQSGWIQILLAVSVTSLCNLLYYFTKKPMIRLYGRIYHLVSNEGHYEILYIPGIIALVLIVMFNLPMHSINQTLNTESHLRYLDFYEELPYDINVNYKQELEYDIDLEGSLSVNDFYVQDNLLYIYAISQDDHILVIDMDTDEIVIDKIIVRKEDYPYTLLGSKHHRIIYDIDDEIVFLTYNGLYQVDQNTTTKISDINALDSTLMIIGEQEAFLQITSDSYILYGYDGSLDEINTILQSDVPNGGTLGVFGETFYVFADEIYYIANSTDFSATIALPIFEQNINDVLYLDDGTNHINGYIYLHDESTDTYYDTGSDYKVLTYESDGEVEGLHRIDNKHAWFFLNKYSSVQDVAYRMLEDNFYYAETNYRSNTTSFSYYQLDSVETDVELPFYSHYHFATLLFVIVGIFIPFWNTDTHTTFVDFVSITNQKKDEA